MKVQVQNEFIEIVHNANNLITYFDENIFFIKPNYTVEHELSANEACSIEAAAKKSTSTTIWVIFVSSSKYVRIKNTKFIKAFKTYDNIRYQFVDVREIALESPLKNFVLSEKMRRSKKISKKITDILKYILLLKYGGFYFDLDIAKVSNEEVNRFDNFLCFDESGYIKNSIIKLSGEEGRKFAAFLLSEVAKQLNEATFVFNNSTLLKDSLKNFYNLSKIEFNQNSVQKIHHNFFILPPKYFPKIENIEKEKIFDEEGKFEKNVKFIKINGRNESDSKMNEIIEKLCPRIYEVLLKRM
ncbi:hypothetical protein PVAND_016313 [Polypedilum vanderplanki]|uniref:Alpha 1,4-glycosyltransferase domain-containing protein n=1 Tax=Polypedilum vanderplanki TaxID=319348 RepID=A0A9J6BES6_POLVA|nr:hypothetical protein PVAND_016313 [Polypedilum vanderplanki]